ncbi:DUF2971 domain-containing protein [Aeromonas hydrophila]|uniref:DUF2971 domain-containing protein n=1 Tax=Aeromonas hydrophila TaxID=644 RepID=UPI0020B3150D|nr:DUF2971 domain-containing protein [Aeromonas hydrophila]MCP3322656.1 DUF2971 domain-containing protein [Aeromonas hydrophila]
MTNLYKYYPSVPNNYFCEPTIKLSQIPFLNDPFEKYISEQAVTLIAEKVYRNKIDDDFIGLFKRSFSLSKYEKGIVSLSETHRNILLWAHYANNHKGVCIGYNADFLSSLPLPKEYDPAVDKIHPVKVKYDSARFDEFEVNHDLDINELAKELTLSSLTRKSDDWIYEKEHRCITPLKWADKILIKNILNLSERTLDRHHSLIEHLRKKDCNAVTIKLDQINNNLTHDYVLEPEAHFLKDIAPENINSIHFGCQMDLNTINRHIKEINESNHNYAHLKVFKYTMNPGKFELDLEQIKL